jgi:alanyl-tRNA synthetase
MRAATQALRTSPIELAERVSAMQKELKELRKRPAAGTATVEAFKVAQTLETGAGKVVIGVSARADPAAMRNVCDQQRQKGAAAVFVGGAGDDKVTLIAMVDESLAAGGKLKAGDWVKAVAPVVGGSGGGKPTLAQAGGKQPEKLEDALRAAAEYARQKLG